MANMNPYGALMEGISRGVNSGVNNYANMYLLGRQQKQKAEKEQRILDQQETANMFSAADKVFKMYKTFHDPVAGREFLKKSFGSSMFTKNKRYAPIFQGLANLSPEEQADAGKLVGKMNAAIKKKDWGTVEILIAQAGALNKQYNWGLGPMIDHWVGLLPTTPKTPTTAIGALLSKHPNATDTQIMNWNTGLKSKTPTLTTTEKNYKTFQKQHPEYKGSILDFKKAWVAKDPDEVALGLAAKDWQVMMGKKSLADAAIEYRKAWTKLKGGITRKGRLTDPKIAMGYLKKAGGDKTKARELAKKDGWSF